MNRTAFSLEVFGDRIPTSGIFERGDNSKQLEVMRLIVLCGTYLYHMIHQIAHLGYTIVIIGIGR